MEMIRTRTVRREPKSVEEKRLKSSGNGDEKLEEETMEDEKWGPFSLGPKTFGSSVEIFDYFSKILHSWPPNLNLNKVTRAQERPFRPHTGHPCQKRPKQL